RWGLGGLVLLLVLEFCAPRSAWAGCHHLVVSKSGPVVGLGRLDELIAGGSPYSPADLGEWPLKRDVSGRRMPCSGPGCSRSRPPPAPPLPPDPNSLDQWAPPLDSLMLLPFGPASRGPVDEPTAGTTGHAPSVFHPPPA